MRLTTLKQWILEIEDFMETVAAKDQPRRDRDAAHGWRASCRSAAASTPPRDLNEDALRAARLDLVSL